MAQHVQRGAQSALEPILGTVHIYRDCYGADAAFAPRRLKNTHAFALSRTISGRVVPQYLGDLALPVHGEAKVYNVHLF